MKITLRQSGLTLTEMLLALAITSVLLAAALQVTMTASRFSAANDTAGKEAPARTQLKRLVTMDILHADKYRQTKNGIEMELHSSLDKESLALKHEPSIVIYRTRQIGGKNWLVRIQRQGGDVWSEFVAVDVIGITPDVPEFLEPLLEPGTWGEISESFALNVIFAKTNELPMRVNCILK